jgi:hypothetical protein
LLVIYTSSALVWQATTEGHFEVDPETWRQFTGTAATRWHS